MAFYLWFILFIISRESEKELNIRDQIYKKYIYIYLFLAQDAFFPCPPVLDMSFDKITYFV